MDFLARREYGFTELCRKLGNKGYDRAIADAAIEMLRDDGLQSDARFAESFVQSRINQGKGPVRIRLDLSQRGVKDAVIDEALDHAAVDWRMLAIDVRTRKFCSAPLDDFRAKAKVMQFLQYRGFESDQIQAAVGFD